MSNDDQDKPRSILQRKPNTSTAELPVITPSDLRSVYHDDQATDVKGEPWNNRTVAQLPQGISARITVVNGPDQIGVSFDLQRAYNSIGRQQTNDVMLRQSAVSSRHAAIYYTEAQEWRIMDLQSTNGTRLNGSRVREFAVHNGDRVGIGDYLLEFKEFRR